MLRKNRPLKLSKDGTMKRVYQALQSGITSRYMIGTKTGIPDGKVAAALYNLVFVGMVRKVRTDKGFRYLLADRQEEMRIGEELRGVNSIFNIGGNTNEK